MYYLSDLKYDLPRKNIIEGLKNINYGRTKVPEGGWIIGMEESDIGREYIFYQSTNIQICYIRMELTTEEIFFCFLDFQYIEAETINYEINPGIYEFNEIVNAFALKIAEHTCKDCNKSWYKFKN